MGGFKKIIIEFCTSILLGIIFGAYIYIFVPETNVLILFLVLVISIPLHLLIHEAGHFVFGLISGYKPSSVRIFSIILIFCQTRGIRVKRVSGFATPGQCLMEPPKLIEPLPYMLYILGGCIANVILSVMAVIAIVFAESFLVFLYIFSFIGAFYAIANSIVMNCSDGGIIWYLQRKPEFRKYLYNQLQINAQMSKGIALKDMPDEYFELPLDVDHTHYFFLYIALLNYNRMLALGEYEKAIMIIDKLWSNIDNELKNYYVDIATEKLFCLCIESKVKEANILYRSYLKGKLPKLKSVEKKRVMMAYALFILHDKELAEEYKAEAIRLVKFCPLQAVAEFEMMLLELLENMSIQKYCK